MFLEILQTTQFRCPWFFTVCFGVFGAVVGSFLNVCVCRIPKGLSVVRPGSRCACGAPIPWFRNIPVLSWLMLRGRAACCGRGFSLRYPLVEALTGGLFAACWALLPWQQALPGMVLGAWLVVLAFIDLDTMLLPDGLNVGLAVAGVLLSVVLPESHGVDGRVGWLPGVVVSLRDSLAGGLVGAGLVYWLRLLASLVAGREAMGEGDVILLGGIGTFCGWQGAVFALFGGAVIGTVVLLPLLLARRICRRFDTAAWAVSLASCEGDETAEMPGTFGAGVEVPFGPWLAVGALVWLLAARVPVGRFVAHFERLLAPIF